MMGRLLLLVLVLLSSAAFGAAEVLVDAKVLAEEGPFARPVDIREFGIHALTPDGKPCPRNIVSAGGVLVPVCVGPLEHWKGDYQAITVVIPVKAPVPGTYRARIESYNAKGHREFFVYYGDKKIGHVATPTTRDAVLTTHDFTVTVERTGTVQLRFVNAPGSTEFSYLRRIEWYCVASPRIGEITPLPPVKARMPKIEIPLEDAWSKSNKAKWMTFFSAGAWTTGPGVPQTEPFGWFNEPRVDRDALEYCRKLYDLPIVEGWKIDGEEEFRKKLDYLKGHGLRAILWDRGEGGSPHTPGFFRRLAEAYPDTIAGIFFLECNPCLMGVRNRNPRTRTEAAQMAVTGTKEFLNHYRGCGVPVIMMKGSGGFLVHHNYEGGADIILPENLNVGGPWLLWMSNLRGAARQYDRPYGDHVSSWGMLFGWDCIESHKPSELELSWYSSFFSDRRCTLFSYECGQADMFYSRPYGAAVKRFGEFARRNPLRGEAVTPLAVVRGYGDGWANAFGDGEWQDVSITPFYLGELFPWSASDKDRALLDCLGVGLVRFGGSAFSTGSEAGLWVGTPFGQFDFVMSNASLDVLKRYYRALLFFGYHQMTATEVKILRQFVEQGGNILIAAGQLGNESESLTGVKLLSREKIAVRNLRLTNEAHLPMSRTYSFAQPLMVHGWKTSRTQARVLAETNDKSPILFHHRLGKGGVFLVNAEYLIDLAPGMREQIRRSFAADLVRAFAETTVRPVEILPRHEHLQTHVLRHAWGYEVFAAHVGGDYVHLGNGGRLSDRMELQPIAAEAKMGELALPFDLQPANLYAGEHKEPRGRAKNYEQDVGWDTQTPPKLLSEAERLQAYRKAYHYGDRPVLLREDSVFRGWFFPNKHLAVAPSTFLVGLTSVKASAGVVTMSVEYDQEFHLRCVRRGELPMSIIVDGKLLKAFHEETQIALTPGRHEILFQPVLVRTTEWK